jgi:hypothetical protein
MRKANTWRDVLKRVQMCEHGVMCEDCCWLWQGPVDRHGYGKWCMSAKTVIVHRALYIGRFAVLLNPTQLVLHKCDIKR